MEITERFARMWTEWDEKAGDRKDVPHYLRGAKDEDLVELLASSSQKDRKYERDVIATEILNRLHRRHRDLPSAADAVLESAEAAYHAASAGQQAIHTAEGILKAQGDEELGTEVSASAYESLDTTKAAFEAAQRNSKDVQRTVSQSRLTHDLAKEATRTAKRASDATRDAADALAGSGHSGAAHRAQKAADKIVEKADAATQATRKEREAEGDPPR